MDTTTGVEQPTPDAGGGDVPELISSLAHVDSADAPETASQIARLLTEELDAVQGEGGSTAGAEQLQAFDRSEAEE